MKTKPDIRKRLSSRSKLCIMHYALCIVALLLVAACGHDDVLPPDVYVEESTPYVELRIAIPVANPTGTRANPMGGEEGNGRERGVLNEDKIHDINVFFYRDDDGMNGDDDTEIDFHFFYNLLDPSDYLNSKVDSILETNQYFGERYIDLKFQYWGQDDISKTEGLKFLAIANIGNLQSQSIKTLGDLRNLDLSKCANAWSTCYDAYSKDASKMDFFLMSTAYNENHTSNGTSTGTNTITTKGTNGDYSGTTTLQRLYARLDLWYNESDNAVKDGDKVKELKYCIVEDDGKGNMVKVKVGENDFADVYITDVLPVNVMKTPSYLFKKVTDFETNWSDWSTSGFNGKSSFKWGGKEDPNGMPTAGAGNDYPLNYVMEPNTLYKTPDGEGGKVNGSFNGWYGTSQTANVKELITTAGNGKLEAYYHGSPTSQTDPDYGCNRIAIISYANENTHPTDCFNSNYLTGMAFRAVYVPDNIYTGSQTTTQKDDEGNDVTVVVPTPWTSDDAAPTWIYRYSPTTKSQKESKSLYFTSRQAAVEYSEAHPEDMAIISPKEKEAETDVEAFTAIQHDGKWGFICYYNLWLRHYNNEDLNSANGDPTQNYPMEYATVRNNIYRVSVSFKGPGDPEPTMREPDTMKARIFVRKWNYREEPTIDFDL